MGIFALQVHIHNTFKHNISKVPLRSRVSSHGNGEATPGRTDIALAFEGSGGITYEVCTKSDKRKRVNCVSCEGTMQVGRRFRKVWRTSFVPAPLAKLGVSSKPERWRKETEEAYLAVARHVTTPREPTTYPTCVRMDIIPFWLQADLVVGQGFTTPTSDKVVAFFEKSLLTYWSQVPPPPSSRVREGGAQGIINEGASRSVDRLSAAKNQQRFSAAPRQGVSRFWRGVHRIFNCTYAGS